MHNRGGGIYSKMLVCVCVCVLMCARLCVYCRVNRWGQNRQSRQWSRRRQAPSQCRAEHCTDIGYSYLLLYSIIRCWFFSRSRIPIFQNKVNRNNIAIPIKLYFFSITPVRRHRLLITVSFNTNFVIS